MERRKLQNSMDSMVCVCMYTHIYICIFTQHTYIHTCLYIRVGKRFTLASTQNRVSEAILIVIICISFSIRTSVSLFLSILYVYVYISVCVYIHVYLYSHMYAHISIKNFQDLKRNAFKMIFLWRMAMKFRNCFTFYPFVPFKIFVMNLIFIMKFIMNCS